jgi:1,4-alpha-glucan branching enzyme
MAPARRAGKGPVAENGPGRDTSPASEVLHGSGYTLLTDDDLYLFNEGTHSRLYDKLGSHPRIIDGVSGTCFSVWAPNAESVTVVGDFNGWDRARHPLRPRASSGIWEGFIPGVGPGTLYKYHIASRFNGYRVDKADPFARCSEKPPLTASRVWRHGHRWQDGEWIGERGARNRLSAPLSIYEVHLGSWRRDPQDRERHLTYGELARCLPGYVKDMGFTHVEFLPVMEHPFYGSWGYQVTGYFAPTARYGTPDELMLLIDELHRNGIGVILDWVPAHFPADEHGLGYFDGSHLYEHADPRQGFHPDWKSDIFNYGRNEVRSFLLSSARFWLDLFHADGLRVDGVASMLYLDYSRQQKEWIPNRYGGNENLEAIGLLRQVNEMVYQDFPEVQTIAEESTAWPMVSRPTYLGGLGFGLKWDMGWMHDTLAYMGTDPVHRKYHHGALTFRIIYAFSENFVLPLSHDEVVHGKGSLLGRMSGDRWQKLANLRLLFALMFGQPGKKMLFMGGEIGQWSEWNHDEELDWQLLDHGAHAGVRQLVRDLNLLYTGERALHELDTGGDGFEWVDCTDSEQSVITFLRKAESTKTLILVACNMTPVVRHGYRVGVPRGGVWQEVINTDASEYGGSGLGNRGSARAVEEAHHGRPFSLSLTLPPLAALVLRSPGATRGKIAGGARE